MTTRVLDHVPAGSFRADNHDNRPDWLQEKGIEVQTTNFPKHVLEHVLRGWVWPSSLLQISYTVLPPDWCSSALELPFFVGFVDHEGERHYFASEDLSRQYADLWILHEAIEFTMYSGPSPDPLMYVRAPYDPCLEALMDELSVAELMGADMKTYILQRYEFFKCLVAFHERHQQISADQLSEMKKSLHALHEKVRMMDI